MARELTAEERDELTPGELAAIMGEDTEAAADAALADTTAASTAAERAEEAAGDKAAAEAAKTGDEEAPVVEEDAKTPKTDEAGEGEGDEEDEPSAEALQAVLDDAAPKPAAPAPVKYQGITEADYKKEAGAIATDKGALMKQLMDGEIDAEAFASKDAELAERRDKLTASFTLAQANRENEATRQQAIVQDLQSNIGKLMKESAKPGAAIDYNKDAKAQRQFDMALQQLADDPDNATSTPAQLVAEADRFVRTLRGIAAAPAAAPAPAPKPGGGKRDAPVTLGGLPAAAPQRIGEDVRSQFNQLQGEEAEDFLARQPASVRQALLQGGAV